MNNKFIILLFLILKNNYISTYSQHKIKGTTFELLPEKAMLWRHKRMLILADIHLGKATHFRKNGIGIPKEVEKENYDRISSLLLNYPIDSVLILGDLFHSEINEQWGHFLFFLKKFNHVSFELVKGNHDILKNESYKSDNLKIYDTSYQSEGFHFTHEPDVQKGLYNICGHIHPGVKIKGQGRQTLKLPCFVFGQNTGILPAFGAFTGLHIPNFSQNDEIYGIIENEVLKLA